MKNIIRLNEGQLRDIVKESVKRILKEEIDLGQVDAMRDSRKKAKDIDPEINKEIRRLRYLISNEDDENKIKTLKNKIVALKKKAGIRN